MVSEIDKRVQSKTLLLQLHQYCFLQQQARFTDKMDYLDLCSHLLSDAGEKRGSRVTQDATGKGGSILIFWYGQLSAEVIKECLLGPEELRST